MQEIDTILQKISLPLMLSDQTFANMGARGRLDLELIIEQLPQNLRFLINLDATAVHSRRGEEIAYILPLLDGSLLKITVLDRFIVDMKTV